MEDVMQCERCGAGPAGADLFDRCALCGLKLCDACMAGGCCGHTPALSGREADEVSDTPEGETSQSRTGAGEREKGSSFS